MARALEALDLNLLPLLEALLEERHVTRAARRVGRSQSAVSHALARLREQLDDELLVRCGRALVPTPFATALREPLRRQLDALEGLLGRAVPFEPARDEARFVVHASDYLTRVVLTPLVLRLRSSAPRVELHIQAPLPSNPAVAAALAEGELDVALLVQVKGDEPCRLEPLYEERLATLVRAGHPLLEGVAPGAAPTLEAFCACSHALIAPQGKRRGFVDAELARRGLRRHIAVTLPHFLAAPELVAGSDLVLTLPHSLARLAVARTPGLRLCEPPLAVPPFTVYLAWHERSERSPAHAWLRAAFREVVPAPR